MLFITDYPLSILLLCNTLKYFVVEKTARCILAFPVLKLTWYWNNPAQRLFICCPVAGVAMFIIPLDRKRLIVATYIYIAPILSDYKLR